MRRRVLRPLDGDIMQIVTAVEPQYRAWDAPAMVAVNVQGGKTDPFAS